LGHKTESASPHEVRLVGETLLARFTDEQPSLDRRKAYDSDPLDERLAEFETELIAPHKANRKKSKTQDGRKLRPYKRRWKIEPVRMSAKLSSGFGAIRLS
jgi:hypothetical protein